MVDEPAPPPQKMTGASKCLIGCLAVMAVVVLIGVVGGVFLFRNFRTLAADAAYRGVEATVRQSDLPMEQRAAIVDEATRFRDDFKSGAITVQQVGLVVQELTRGPMMPMLNIWVVQSHVSRSAGLTAAEKEDARLQVQRFSRGVFEKKIDHVTVEQVMVPVTEATPNGAVRQVKPVLTDEELKRFVAELKGKADGAMVPNEAYQPDVAGELKKAIDKALGRG